jgi:hypothetical protein
MPSASKKTAQTIIESENDYLGALKGNQSGLLTAVKNHFQPEQRDFQMSKGHGRNQLTPPQADGVWKQICSRT